MENNQEVSGLARDLEYLSIEERRQLTQNTPAPTEQSRKISFDHVVHACECESGDCKRLNCRAVKQIFQHDLQCRIGVDTCYVCKLMWHLFKLHAQECKQSSSSSSNCSVPHCRDLKLRKTFDPVVHSFECDDGLCKSQYCLKVKELMQHFMVCEIHAVRGCSICMDTWRVLNYHARACQEFDCVVLRCRDLKVYFRAEQQSASQGAGTS